MIIYVWPSGRWLYEWDLGLSCTWSLYSSPVRIDLDRVYDYELTPLQMKACEEALGE